MTGSISSAWANATAADFLRDAREVASDLSEPGAATPAIAARRLVDMTVAKVRDTHRRGDRKLVIAAIRGKADIEHQDNAEAESRPAAFYGELARLLADHDSGR